MYSFFFVCFVCRVQQDLCSMEDRKLALVPDISHRYDHISGTSSLVRGLVKQMGVI